MNLRKAFCLLSLCAAACGSPADQAPPPPGGSYYAVATTLNANTAQATSLIFTTPSLAAGASVDTSQGISVPDVVTIFGIEGAGKVYSTQAMSPIVTEYTIADNGVITPGTQLSFASFGLTGGFSTRAIVMVSPTKAYLLDDTTLQAITFDPEAMTIGKSISLGGMAESGYTTSFSYNIPVRNSNGQVVVTGYHYDQTFSQTIATTSVAFIDTATDAVSFIKDTRCGDFSSIAAAPSGDLYFASDTYSTALYMAGGTSVAPEGCLLRMQAGANQFDAGFFVKIKSITGTDGGGVVAGTGNSVYVRGYDQSIMPVVMGTTTAIQILGAAAWKWWKIDLANPTAQAVVSQLGPSAGQLNTFVVGGEALVVNTSADFLTTALLDMSAAGGPQAGASVMGRTKGIVKAR